MSPNSIILINYHDHIKYLMIIKDNRMYKYDLMNPVLYIPKIEPITLRLIEHYINGMSCDNYNKYVNDTTENYETRCKMFNATADFMETFIDVKKYEVTTKTLKWECSGAIMDNDAYQELISEINKLM